MNSLLFAAILLAQPPASTPAQKPQTPATQPGKPVGPEGLPNFADDPLVIDAAGLTMRVPAGALLQTSNAPDNTKVAIIAPDGASWAINVQIPTTANPDVTVKDAADRTIQELLNKHPLKDSKTREVVGSAGQVLSRIDNLKIPGSPTLAERFYVSLPNPNKGTDARTIYGYTVFKPSPTQFVVFELICPEKTSERARNLYELAIATAKFENPQLLAAARRDAVKTGIAILSRIGADQFDQACAEPERWYRMYKPAPSGAPGDAEERGYRSVRFFKGTRAQIDSRIVAGSPKAATSDTNPDGYLAQIIARSVLPATVKSSTVQVVDIEGIYFCTPNLQQEAWSIRMIVRDQTKPRVFTETATRGDRSMTVISDLPGKPSRTAMPGVPDEGYLPQVFKFLLPRELVRTGLEGDTALYCYTASTQSIVLRRDTLSRDPATNDTFIVSTREREGSEPQRYFYKSNGVLIKAELEDGVLMEPIALDKLVKRWKDKGLPVSNE